ncbi:MAG: hypothetical protein RR294_04800 [Bacilli bacterium]
MKDNFKKYLFLFLGFLPFVFELIKVFEETKNFSNIFLNIFMLSNFIKENFNIIHVIGLILIFLGLIEDRSKKNGKIILGIGLFPVIAILIGGIISIFTGFSFIINYTGFESFFVFIISSLCVAWPLLGISLIFLIASVINFIE